MAKKHANTLTDKRLKMLLDEVVSTNPNPLPMRVAFMLSFYAGLRVAEIAGLDWRMHVMGNDGEFRVSDFPVYDVSGEVLRDSDNEIITTPVESLFIGSDIGKCGMSRVVPLKDDLKVALRALFDDSRGAEDFPSKPHVIPSAHNGANQQLTRRAHALKMRINRIYVRLGLQGCTSHSGRRSFITRASQKANAVGMSLRDVQALAGHRNLTTTEAYIDVSDQHNVLVNVLWT